MHTPSGGNLMFYFYYEKTSTLEIMDTRLMTLRIFEGHLAKVYDRMLDRSQESDRASLLKKLVTN